MSRFSYALCVAVALFALLSVSSAQVPTGTPPFGSFGGGPFDVVNLGTLNAHFDINVLTKAGRVTPFTYDITYDTSIWYPTVVNGSEAWQPVAGYGWNYPSCIGRFDHEPDRYNGSATLRPTGQHADDRLYGLCPTMSIRT